MTTESMQTSKAKKTDEEMPRGSRAAILPGFRRPISEVTGWPKEALGWQGAGERSAPPAFPWTLQPHAYVSVLENDTGRAVEEAVPSLPLVPTDRSERTVRRSPIPRSSMYELALFPTWNLTQVPFCC